MARRRLAAAAAGIVLSASLTACGGGKTSSPPAAEPTAAAPPAAAPTPDTRGRSIKITDDRNSVFDAGPASPAQSAATYSDGNETKSASNGTFFVMVELPLRNPLGDRAERLPYDPSGGPSYFQFVVPKADAAKFGLGFCEENQGLMPVPAGLCVVQTFVGRSTPAYEFETEPQLEAGATVKVLLVTEAPPHPPLKDLELFFGGSRPVVQIPIASR